MSVPPNTLVFFSGYSSEQVTTTWARLADLKIWPEIFPDWIAAITASADCFTASGVGGERFDLYPNFFEEQYALDVERVDEMGSADVMRIRLLAVRGGSCFVAISAARIPGIPDPEWRRFHDGINDGLAALK